LTIEIRYWDREAWINYLKHDVLPFYSSLLIILNLWKKLKEVTHGKFLSDILKNMPSLELAFIAGTSPPDRYEEDGLALIYKSLLGASIKLCEYYFLKSFSKEPKTVCMIEKTIITDYLDHIHFLLNRLLMHVCELELITCEEVQNIQESSQRTAKEILVKPEGISEGFVNLLNKALGLTITYNEYTRFVWYLRKISKKYIKEFYPELLKPEASKFIQKLLGLREYIVPQVEDPDIIDMYTIFSFDYAVKATEPTRGGYAMIDGIYVDTYEYFTGQLTSIYEPYETVGGCLCRINELIWGLFHSPLTRDRLRLVVSGEVPDPFKEWQTATTSNPPPLYRLDYPDSYEDLSMLDECLPAIFIGRGELVKGESGVLYIFRRW
jgi:hypothetical protein